MSAKNDKEVIAVLRKDRDTLRRELEIAENRVEELHGVIERKNAIIHLMSFGDNGDPQVVNDINNAGLALLP